MKGAALLNSFSADHPNRLVSSAVVVVAWSFQPTTIILSLLSVFILFYYFFSNRNIHERKYHHHHHHYHHHNHHGAPVETIPGFYSSIYQCLVWLSISESKRMKNISVIKEIYI